MPSLKSRLSARLGRFREQHPQVEHAVATVRHYEAVNGKALAGAVTFFGFLSFFPILALGFFVVGVLAQVFPDLRAEITAEISNLLPGVIGNDVEAGEIPIKTFERYAATLGVIGLVGVLYSGLGWLGGMRTAMETVFVTARRERPGFLSGMRRDTGALLAIGATLLVSVGLSGLVAGFSERVLVWLGFDPEARIPNALLWLLVHGLAVAVSTVLLLTMFTLLAHPHVPRRSLVAGALLGAVGFEVLKTLASSLIALTKETEAFQAFGVALILLVWINYFSRLVMYAGSFAYTSPAAAALRAQESMRAPAVAIAEQDHEAMARVVAEAEAASVPDAQAVPAVSAPVPARIRPGATLGPVLGSLFAGAAAGAGAVAVLVRRRGRMGR
jgi:membrane protein